MTEILLKGRYRNLAEIGRGQHAVTYKAHDASLNRTVVVKVLRERHAVDQRFVAAFQRAAQAIAGLSHPNIVAVHDIGSDRDLHYIVTEYVDGQNLESLLASEAPLTRERALDIGIPVSAALGAAHRAGYVHGRLTPRNILLTKDQQVKVTDFGVTDTPVLIPQGEESASRYAAFYLSPEHAMGRRITPASDVYSLGVILYEMLAGRPPFDGESFSEIANMHIREIPEPLESVNEQVPGSLSLLVHRALAKTSTERYRTADALEEALESYRRQSGTLEFVERLREEEARRTLAPTVTEDEVEAHRGPPTQEGISPDMATQAAGPDGVGCILGAVAFLAILGLIPLWLAVFLRYFA